MYISELTVENFRCFGEGDEKLTLPLREGLTAMVGENDNGKTAVIDALRFALGTRDQEYFRVEEQDFHSPRGGGERRKEIRIRCKFQGLTSQDKGAFAEFLSYENNTNGFETTLYLNWTARQQAGARGNRRYIAVEVRSGQCGDGLALDVEARNLLRGTYLRPLRDAERALAAGRGSRLSQILQHTKEVQDSGSDYDAITDPSPDPNTLSVLGVGDYASALLGNREGIKAARKRLNDDYLKPLSFNGDELIGHIGVSVAGAKEIRLRQLLEKLELELQNDNALGQANRGLGSNNILFMACELLLLGSETDDFPLLLIEEPEAHLHPQRQLRLMQFLQNQVGIARSDGQKIQVIVTTHSSNLASAISLDNLVTIKGGRAYALGEGWTRLEKSDYRFLERFLDVTKANLFFARGVVIVEGDGENILLPTLARLIGYDFSEYGVSLVNVGHTGLRRFARIFQRANPDIDGILDIPVACITDMDVMPDCAPVIIGKVKDGDAWPEKKSRRWRAKHDFSEQELSEHRASIITKASGQRVETFVADEWTLEYDLAFSGLAGDVWISATLARQDDKINVNPNVKDEIIVNAQREYDSLRPDALTAEELASKVYSLFTTGTKASKAVTAQYLAERLESRLSHGEMTVESLLEKLPDYLKAAIKHVTISQQSESADLHKTESEGD